MKYSALTMRYFEAALDEKRGALAGPGTFRGAAGSRARGNWVQFEVQVDAGIIQAARFSAFACPHTIAASAWVAERSVGRDLGTALPASLQDLSERFGVPVEKWGRLLTIEDAWAAAVLGAPQR